MTVGAQMGVWGGVCPGVVTHFTRLPCSRCFWFFDLGWQPSVLAAGVAAAVCWRELTVDISAVGDCVEVVGGERERVRAG